jgi:tRNA(fMet)-specific endonuclease VapC
MTRYLLDTNVCIEILRGRNAALKSRLAATEVEKLALSSVVLAELHYGARLAKDPDAELVRVKAAFAGWPRLPFDDAAAERYGQLRAGLKQAGNLIGANDLLIAASALANELVLVTHNIREFSRVPGLVIDDWQA